MKVFISADIEGVTTSTFVEEGNPSHPSYALHAKQMTEEVLAVIQGAKDAGATEITVKDAHAVGGNIDPTRMPSGVTLIRNTTGHPYLMVYGIDKSYDAAMFVGYHSAAGREGNPLSHTLSGRHIYIKINGETASEFMLYSYACALEGVPTVFLSGDKMLCDDSSQLHPKLITCPVKDGLGAASRNYSVEDTLKSLRELSAKALRQDFGGAPAKLPGHYDVEICFKDHSHAEKVSWFPGVTKKTANIITFSSDSLFEVLRTIMWTVC
jgi:D-amino peptidase